MKRLTELLGDVPPAEREEAIQYYNDYFDDAGIENESGVIASLGSPEELARTIKAGLSDGGNGGEFTESGFSGYTQVHKDEVIRASDAPGTQDNTGTGAGQSYAGGWTAAGQAGGMGQENRTGGRGQESQFSKTAQAGGMGDSASAQSGNTYYEDDYYRRTGGNGVYGGREDTRRYSNPYGQNNADGASGTGASYQGQGKKQGMSGGMIVVIVILAVLTSPVWIGLLGGFVGLAGGILAALLGIFLAFLIVGVALLVVAVALLVAGISVMFSTPLGGLCVIGTAFVSFAVGLLFMWLMVLMAGMAIPALVRGIVSLCRKIFHSGGVRV